MNVKKSESMDMPAKLLSMLHISEVELPAVKGWTVGKEYEMRLKVKQVGSRIEDFGPDKGKVQASFHVLKASSESNPKLSKRYAGEHSKD